MSFLQWLPHAFPCDLWVVLVCHALSSWETSILNLNSCFAVVVAVVAVVVDDDDDGLTAYYSR